MEGCLEGVKGGKGAHEHRKSPAAQFPLTHLLSIKYPATPHFLSPSGLFLSLLAWENTHKHPREKWDCRQTEDVRQAPSAVISQWQAHTGLGSETGKKGPPTWALIKMAGLQTGSADLGSLGISARCPGQETEEMSLVDPTAEAM